MLSSCSERTSEQRKFPQQCKSVIGALGDSDQLQPNSLQQSARLAQEVVDTEALKTGFEAAMENLQKVGRNVASAIFD
jgi:hypothetical protein